MDAVNSIEDFRRPELSGLSMKAALLYVETRFGAPEVEAFLSSHGVSREYLADSNNWISYRFVHDLLSLIRDKAGSEKACWEAGTFTFKPEVLGRAIWVGLKSVGTPVLCFKQVVKSAQVYNRVGAFNILESKQNRLLLEYRAQPGFSEEDKLFCQYRLGQFAAIPTIWGLPFADCTETSCIADGEDACVYEFRWQLKPSHLYPLTGMLLCGMIGLLVDPGDLRHTGMASLLFPSLFMLTGYLAGKMLSLRRALVRNESVNKDQHQALESSIESISEKYVELQQSNKALEEAHQELTLHKEHLEELVDERTRELQESKAKLEESYEKLQELDKMKMVFFNNISHELRTPLALTIGPVEAMLQGELGVLPARQKEYLVNIHNNALRLLKLINNLLDLAKLEDGKMSLIYGKYSLQNHLLELVESFRVTAEKRGIRLQTEGDPDMQPVCFDREKVEKVFLNLLGNAMKFTPQGGSIVVRWGVEGAFANVQVLDSGPGIPEESLDKIFDRFVQVDNSESRHYGGTGIGLSLAREIAELHGGSVQAANRPEGGANFSFTLPLGEKELADAAATSDGKEGWAAELFRKADFVEDVERQGTDASSPGEGADGDTEQDGIVEDASSPLVLVVEDNEDMRGFIADCLRKEFRVRTAVDGKDGWEKLHRLSADMIVSDIMMPRWNGYELCNAVKKDETLKQIPLLLLSSKSEVDMKVQGFEKGADDYLTKPFNPRELLARVKNQLRLRDLEREVMQQNRQLEQTLSDLKEAQTQLVHSEKMASLGVMSAGLVHEINNPLNASISSVRTLVRSLDRIRAGEVKAEEVSEKMDRVANRSLQGLKRCEQIITGLLRFSRKDAKGKKDADIIEGLETSVTLLNLDPKKKVKIHQDYRFRGKVYCDPGQLNQVFMNILTNAYQAIEDAGEIRISTEQAGDDMVVTVQDTGSGMPSEVISKVFEPFYTTKEVGKGTGLGLSISHKIVEEHGGKIEIESAPGEGSTFRIRLPMHAQEKKRTEESPHGSIRKAVGL